MTDTREVEVAGADNTKVALLDHEGPRYRDGALRGLQACGPDAALPVLSKMSTLLADPNDFIRITATRVIGEVAAVYLDEGFVLIRRYGGGELPSGHIYTTIGPGGRTATLKPTGERSGRFYAADLTAGEVERGDSVVLRLLPEGRGPEVTPVQEKAKTPFGME